MKMTGILWKKMGLNIQISDFLCHIRMRSTIDMGHWHKQRGAPGSGTIEFDTGLILKLE